MGKSSRKRRRLRGDTEGLVMTYLDESELRNLYVVLGLSMAEIGRRHGCSKQYVSVLVRRYQVSRARFGMGVGSSGPAAGASSRG